MPRYQQSITLPANTETALLTAYQAFKDLGWKIEMAGDHAITASPAAIWKSKDFTVMCLAENGQLTVSSETVSDQVFDLMKKNKKNTVQFIDAFNKALVNPASTAEENITALSNLREYSREKIAADIKNAEEISRAMNLQGSNLYVTYGIIAINVIVFILMVANGAGIITPNGLVHLRWGSNYPVLTYSGDWWRLITNMFIHFGIIHLLMNMYCLYTIGIYLEPMLGKVKYTIAYLCTGMLASIVSLWWHTEPANSAGASGAVFGMYGVFLALLTTKLIPDSIRKALLQSIGIFIVYNLAYGLKSGVDNAAHVGGLLSGFLIGYSFVPVIKKEKSGVEIKWVPAAVLALTVVGAIFFLEQNKVSSGERNALLNELKEEGYPDWKRFGNKLEAFDKVNQEVYSIISNDSLSRGMLLQKIDETAVPGWDSVEKQLRETIQYDISPASHEKAAKLVLYIDLRKQELQIIKQLNSDSATNEMLTILQENRKKSDALYSEIVNKK